MSAKCQKSLDYIKQFITTHSMLIYPDPDKKYYLFTESSKNSWSRVLAQYDEQEQEGRTKLSIPHPIMYQSGTFQGFQKKLEYVK